MGQQMSKRLQDSLSLIGQMLVYLLIIASFFLYWKIVSGIMLISKRRTPMLTGRFAVFFWIGEVLMTYLVPIGY